MMLLSNLIFVAFVFRLINARMQEFSLELNDILSDKLMPMSLVMLEAGGEETSDSTNSSSHKTLDEEFQCVTKENTKGGGKDGTFGNAFTSMGFHRKMINNFLCSKFIAEKILDDIQPGGMKDRLGVAKVSPEMEFMANNSLSFDGGGKKSHMLYDEGSFAYKNWLAK